MKLNLATKGAIGLVAALSVSTLAMAAEEHGELDAVKAAAQQMMGARANISDIKLSPMEGVYQITVNKRNVYASQVGKHLLLGDVYDLERDISLTDELKQSRAMEMMAEMPEAEMIVFGDDSAKRTITVYTDVDCGYCQKLHRTVPALLAGGVKVRYVWYPRAGVGSSSYKKAVSVWCADDQQLAMDNAKIKREFTDKTCDPNPVAAQYKTGELVGVRGTPTIVVDDGTIIGGYLPAEKMLKRLGLSG